MKISYLYQFFGLYLHDANKKQTQYILPSARLYICRCLESILGVSIKSVIDDLSKFCVTKLIPVLVIGTSRTIDRFNCINYYLFRATAPPPMGQDVLIHEVSRSHKTTQRSQ